VALPRAVGQVPVYYNHKSGGGRSQMLGDYTDLAPTPLYPFGHGLSYTRFTYANLEIAPRPSTPTTALHVAVDVTNSGTRPGDEVVQLYMRDPVASVSRPLIQLRGFRRVALQPGQTRHVRFTLDPSQLAFFDAVMRFVIEPGAFHIMVGASSDDIRAETTVTLEGEIRELTTADLRPTEVE
jgi:beta-glucosidase